MEGPGGGEVSWFCLFANLCCCCCCYFVLSFLGCVKPFVLGFGVREGVCALFDGAQGLSLTVLRSDDWRCSGVLMWFQRAKLGLKPLATMCQARALAPIIFFFSGAGD